MTHVLLWMLLYPLVAAMDTVARAQVWDFDVGRHNAAHVGVYAVGTLIMIAMHYV
jgi:hypothetical protein